LGIGINTRRSQPTSRPSPKTQDGVYVSFRDMNDQHQKLPSLGIVGVEKKKSLVQIQMDIDVGGRKLFDQPNWEKGKQPQDLNIPIGKKEPIRLLCDHRSSYPPAPGRALNVKEKLCSGKLFIKACSKKEAWKVTAKGERCRCVLDRTASLQK